MTTGELLTRLRQLCQYDQDITGADETGAITDTQGVAYLNQSAMELSLRCGYYKAVATGTYVPNGSEFVPMVSVFGRQVVTLSDVFTSSGTPALRYVKVSPVELLANQGSSGGYVYAMDQQGIFLIPNLLTTIKATGVFGPTLMTAGALNVNCDMPLILHMHVAGYAAWIAARPQQTDASQIARFEHLRSEAFRVASEEASRNAENVGSLTDAMNGVGARRDSTWW
jgi:hypothetical protein